MHVRITLKECRDDSALLRLLQGKWFWFSRIKGFEENYRSGFAHTEARARKAAERAGQKLVRVHSAKADEYTIEMWERR